MGNRAFCIDQSVTINLPRSKFEFQQWAPCCIGTILTSGSILFHSGRLNVRL